ncbi:MAG: ParB/RepB/Spo0J family partition protein [Ignavibacteriales bacterium]|nr:ParB/RepB/Spo0J family partition protein [Ignavibacteriales bacterium]
MTEVRSKSVLGKGLSALIPRVPEKHESASISPLPKDAGQTSATIEIELSRVSPNPFQPRLDFDQRTLDELKQSIKQNGIIQPITVRRLVNGTFELISGERRMRASQELGLKTIPAYVMKVDGDAEMLELGLIENLQREDLNPIEVALSFKRLIDECQLTQDEVAEKVGKERSTVTNFLRLLKLPEKIQKAVRDNKISMGHARSLLSVSDEKKQLKLFTKIVDEGWSVRKIEEAVKGKESVGKKKSSGSRGSSLRGDSTFQSIETQLRHKFGTKVTIRKNGSGGGEIGIEYYNPDDLERLLELLEE